MANPKPIVTPFAENGTRNEIPEAGADQPQKATMSGGWGVITQTPINDGGIPPERADFNGLGHLTTSHLAFLNRGQWYGYDPTFAGQIGGYPLNARLMLDNGDIVKSTIPNNTNDPNLNMLGWESVEPKNYFVTPEDFGAGLTSDDSNAIESFFNACGSGSVGIVNSNSKYFIKRVLNPVFSKTTHIDFNGSELIFDLNIEVGQSTSDSINFKSYNNTYLNNVSVTIDNIFINLSNIPVTISTTFEDRRGVRGLYIENCQNITLNNYKCDGAFYGQGLMLSRYNSAILNNLQLPNCGIKFNPTSDNTGAYDAAGDALYLVNIMGEGKTIINGITAYSQEGYYGRGGIVLEQFGTDTVSHIVTVNSVNMKRYHRALHQEDHGVGVFVVNNGSISDFSNMIYNLGGLDGVCYLRASNINITVNPLFGYGGTSGVNNFQNLGYSELIGCNTTYSLTVVERGNKIVRGGSIKILDGAFVDHGASSKTHLISDCDISTDGGLLKYSSSNKGVSISGGSLTGKSNEMTSIIYSINGLINITNDCKITNASIIGENTTTIGNDSNNIRNCSIEYIGTGEVVFLSSSSQTGFNVSDSVVKSTNGSMVINGDGATRHSFSNCTMYNVQLYEVNTNFTDFNGFLRLNSNNLYYSDSFPHTSVVSSFGELCSVISNNNIFDATTAQLISLPPSTAKTILSNNHIVKSGSIT